MPKCEFPTCTRHVKAGFCDWHRIYSAQTEKPKKRHVIHKKSAKQKVVNKTLAAMYKNFLSLPENKLCKMQYQGCAKVASVVHHTRGRTAEFLYDTSTWMASCSLCNVLVEADPQAYEKGFKQSKFLKT